MLGNLFYQIEFLSKEQQAQVEVISVIDNKKMILGDKRTKMVQMSQGEYVVQADDDDRVEFDYVRELLTAIETGADVITFHASVSLNGAPAKICFYSKEYQGDYNTPTTYHRLPNHLMCVKRELALQVPFQSIGRGEDADYAKRLKPLLVTEHRIEKVLYHYDFNQTTTETQK